MTPFFEPDGHNFSNWPCVHYGAEFSDWLRQGLWGRILRGHHQKMRLWNCLEIKWLRQVLWWSGHHYTMLDIMKSFMTQSPEIGFILHSFDDPLWWLDIISFCEFTVKALIWLLPIGINQVGPTVADDTQLLYSQIAWGQGGREEWCKSWFQVTVIREYSPETMNIVRVLAAHHC